MSLSFIPLMSSVKSKSAITLESEEYKRKVKELPEDTIEIIGTDILDMESVDELRKYF